ncbi:MAG TPA: GNAT family N-acetyltransferase [Candidatus Limnocylindria bacterium]|nr:GNAT family N-acetyltransferase [Candidatus Limnocylindria bacterium]
MTLGIRRTTPADTDTVLGILDDAARWVAGRRVPGWQTGQWARTRIQSAIERGETYLAHDGDTVVGTVNVQWTDPKLWPHGAHDAGYVHRLAVARPAHGRSIGRELLTFAEGIAREQGKRFLRLDCMCASAGLREYYAAAGFRSRGERHGQGRTGAWCAALFEKALRS